MSSLFLLSSLSIGGSERKSVRIVNALRGRGRDVHMAWLNGPETLRQDLHSDVPTMCFDRRGKFSWPVVRRLARYVREHGISCIVCMNQYPLLYAQALKLAIGKTAPSCFVTVNTTEFDSRKGAAQMTVYAPLMRRAARIVFGCDYQLNLWVDRFRLPRSRCRHIYNGVDSEYFSPHASGMAHIDHRTAFGYNQDDFVVGTVGKFRPEKQQGDLIEAVARLRARGLPATALLVGDGNEKRSLVNRAASAGIADYVRFPGEARDVRPGLAAMDIFVLTSTSETFSNAALEAMSMKRPVVITDVGGAREMVRDGVNGYLYPPSDVTGLSTILEGLARNPDAVRQLGAEARHVTLERFSFSRMVDQYDSLCVDSRDD